MSTLKVAVIPLIFITGIAFFPRNGDNAFATSSGDGNVWIAWNGGISKVSASTGSLLFSIQTSTRVRAVAVDDSGMKIWAFGGGYLYCYDFSGNQLVKKSVSFDDVDDDEGDDDARPVSLFVNGSGGRVWLAVHNILYHLDGDGALLHQVEMGKRIISITGDAEGGKIWVGVAKDVFVYDESGYKTRTIDLEKAGVLKDIYYDAANQSLWVATGKGLYVYSGDGDLKSRTKLDGARKVAGNGAGVIWATQEDKLVKLDSSGAILLKISPLKGDRKINAIAVDAGDSSVWSAAKRRVSHFSASGESDISFNFTRRIFDLAVYKDVIAPSISVSSPSSGGYVNTGSPALNFSYSDTGLGVNPDTITVTDGGGNTVGTACSTTTGAATCTPLNAFAEGRITLNITVNDYAGNLSPPASVSFTVDTITPTITLDAPLDGALTNESGQTFSGKLSEQATLTADISVTDNGQTTTSNVTFGVAADNTFGQTVSLQNGENTITLRAKDNAANATSKTIHVTVDTVAPTAPDTSKITVSAPSSGMVTITGLAGSVEGGAWIIITNGRSGDSVTAQAGSDGSFGVSIAAKSKDTLTITAKDAAGNKSDSVTVETPASSAPPEITENTGTTLNSYMSFLFTGDNPRQKGVADGTISARRMSAIRGKIADRDGNPISDVTVSILGHSEYGYTTTDGDGMFDIAVNGGSLVTVKYAKDGYLPVHRKVYVKWQEYGWAEDAVMIQYDSKVTTIDLTSSTPQVARGNVVTDDDGTRQATMFFPAGLTASINLAEGGTRQVTSLSVRATEYTVGESGFDAMPGELPATSGYTYAVEVSADEAVNDGIKIAGKDVNLNRNIYFYVDNFLNFPVGLNVPVGYYDNDKGAWIPSEDGVVIKILSVADGKADVDIDGSGVAAGAAALASIGMTDDERTQLATLYQAGKTLWRAPFDHLSSYDLNFPNVCEDGYFCGAASPEEPPVPVEKPKEDTPCTQNGSVIECQNMTLGESVELPGVPFDLNYRSDRFPGRVSAYTLDIKLTPDTIASDKKIGGVWLEILIAGQRFHKTFAATPGLSYTYTWNGEDVFGRTLRGAQKAKVRIGYIYPAMYSKPGRNAKSFGSTSGVVLSGSSARREIYLSREWEETIGTMDARDEGLGGWTPDVHHTYDPNTGTLYMGDGTKRKADNQNTVIKTYAGGATSGSNGDGGSALKARLSSPYDVSFGPDGSMYVVDTGNHNVRKISVDGIISTFAGTGAPVAGGGDGGPATQATMRYPIDVVAAPDGSVYIAEENRIRKVGTDGIITTFAGTGSHDYNGDDIPATQANIGTCRMALAKDGSLYLADSYNVRVHRISPDGYLNTIYYSGYWALAPFAVTVGADGNVYFAARNAIFRISPFGGSAVTVAGTFSVPGFSGDGGDAKLALFGTIAAIHADTDGSLYIADGTIVRWINPLGIVNTLAGNGSRDFTGDGGPPVKAALYHPHSATVGPDGNVYITDSSNARVRRLEPSLPAFSTQDIAIASEDGGQLYQFDSSGRHQKTLDAYTGATLFSFAYDANGYLTTITDGDGLATTITRSSDGVPSAITGSYGQTNTLALDANGYLATVTTPSGAVTNFAYTNGGLLNSMTDHNGGTYSFTYDDMGRLTKDSNPASGSWTLARTKDKKKYTITMTSAEGRSKKYEIDYQSTGAKKWTNTSASGLTATTTENTNGTSSTTSPTGMTTSATKGPDPRWGMVSPIDENVSIKTPSGLTSTVTHARTVALSNSDDRMSMTSQTDTVTINGRKYTAVYTNSSRQSVSTSPTGRKTNITTDTQGRVTQKSISSVSPVNYTYDTSGRMSAVTQGARATSFGYNQQGHLASVTDSMGRAVNIAYDTDGRITSQTLPDGRIINYTYDGNGNVTSVSPPGKSSHGFAYTPVDLTSKYDPPSVDAASPATRYTYNRDKQLTTVTRPDGKTINYSYDGGGRLSSVITPEGVTNYTYNSTTGTLTSVATPDGQTLTHTYDGSLRTTSTWSGAVNGTVGKTHDNNFRVTAHNVNSGNTINYGYDNDSLLTTAGSETITRDTGNGFITGTTLGSFVTTKTHNTFGETASDTAKYNDTAMYDAQYTRDNIGRITSKTETIDGASTTYGYTYDTAGRLTDVSKDGVNVSHYEYDTNGNRLSATTSGETKTGVYDAQDRMLTYGNTTYTYTANGELSSKTVDGATTTYTYDARGNLTSVTLPGGTVITYVIDGSGRRIAKRVNDIFMQGYLYKDSLNPIATLDRDGSVDAVFVYGSKPNIPDYMTKAGVTYRIVSDHLGSPRLVVNTSTGDIAQRLDYNEYGVVTTDTNPGFVPFGFAGGLYDQYTGLVRFGARDYDAESGRWTAKDPILFDGGDTNLYGYVINDPVNWVDPDGENPIAGAIGGAAIGGPVGAAVGAAIGLGIGAALGQGIIDYYQNSQTSHDAIPSANEMGNGRGGKKNVGNEYNEQAKAKHPRDPDARCKYLDDLLREEEKKCPRNNEKIRKIIAAQKDAGCRNTQKRGSRGY